MKRTKITQAAAQSVSPLAANDRKDPRPTIPTPALIARICARVRQGLPLETAALTCGVTRLTLYHWLRTADTALASGGRDSVLVTRLPAVASAKEGHTSHLVSPKPRATADVTPSESLCIELVTATDQAAAQADIRDMAIIAKAAKTNWRAAAWILNHWDEMAKQSALLGLRAPPALPALSSSNGPALSQVEGSNIEGSQAEGSAPKRQTTLTSDLRNLTSRLFKGTVRLRGAN